MAWIRRECHTTGHDAADAVCVGDGAETLARSTAAMTEGRIGFAHLRLIARTAEDLAGSPHGIDEERLLRAAAAHSPNRFRRDCAHLRHVADAGAFLAAQQEAVAAPTLQMRPLGDDRGWWIRGFLDPVGGATVHSALAPLTRPVGASDDRPLDRRLADALVELAAHCLDTGAPPPAATCRISR